MRNGSIKGLYKPLRIVCSSIYKGLPDDQVKEAACFMLRRMAVKTLALWLLLVAMLVPQRCCQHWSYGLSPGGKRQVDSLSETLGNIVEGLPQVDTPCRVIGCAEESRYARMYRLKGFLDSVADRGNGHRTYEK